MIAAGAKTRRFARRAAGIPITAMKSHGATPAMPNTRSKSIPGRPIQNSNETNEIEVAVCFVSSCG